MRGAVEWHKGLLVWSFGALKWALLWVTRVARAQILVPDTSSENLSPIQVACYWTGRVLRYYHRSLDTLNGHTYTHNRLFLHSLAREESMVARELL